VRNISPSLLSADFTQLSQQVYDVVNAGANRLHLDVMDGHFVPNITFGPFIIKQIRKITNAHLETHLMITEPHRYLEKFIEAGSDTVIIHQEASTDIERDLKYIRSKGIMAGIALNPDTSEKTILPILDQIDYILVMSVFPGFGGQSFIEHTLGKMKKLVTACNGKDIIIGVDGGVNLETISKVYKTGIDVTIVGSGLYKADNIEHRFQELLNV